MTEVRTYNAIAEQGLGLLHEAGYTVSPAAVEPQAILLRSHKLSMEDVPATVYAIARAGAGTNNIDVPAATERGIVVFNTPGANSNAVAELVLGGMLGVARNMFAAERFVRGLSVDELDGVEKAKAQFSGTELCHKQLGLIGLGAIGVKLANHAIGLGMSVAGVDEFLTPDNALTLDPRAERRPSIDAVLRDSQYVSLHVPLLDSTTGLVGERELAIMPVGAVLLNFSRGPIVDDAAVVAALDAGHLKAFVTDFPSETLHTHPGVVELPHLGASTEEAEVTCSVMAAQQTDEFLGTGSITNSVNFPNIAMPWSGDVRAVVLHADEAGALNHITEPLEAAELNIADTSTRRRKETGVACTLMDIDTDDAAGVVELIGQINASDQVLRTRVIVSP